VEIREVIQNTQLVKRMIVDFYLINFHPAGEPEAFAAVGAAVGGISRGVISRGVGPRQVIDIVNKTV